MAPATLLLMRHAEKPDKPDDPHLSQAGRERAKKLAVYIPEAFGAPDYLFAAADSDESHRPKETLEPLSEAAGLKIHDKLADKHYAKLAPRLLLDERYDGCLLVVCWHHGRIPDFAEALGAPEGSCPNPWPSDVFNLILKFRYKGSMPKVKQVTEPF